MTCRGFIQLLLKTINVLFTLVGLAMIGYGIYMVITWNNSSSSSTSPPPPPPSSESSLLSYRSPPSVIPIINMEKESADAGISALQLRRGLLEKVPHPDFITQSSFWSNLPSAWFLYLFIVVGVVITLITCSGYIAAATANGCCLSCYSVFVGLLMVLELALAAFIFFDHDWQEVIPDDSTGELDSIENFIEDQIDILKWVALGAIIVQAFALLFAIILRALGSKPVKDYDSDDEYAASRASRQPLLIRQPTSGPGTSAAGSDGRPARTDAWSTRMREKYGLDTTEFSYNPTESKRFSQQAASTEENKRWCTIM